MTGENQDSLTSAPDVFQDIANALGEAAAAIMRLGERIGQIESSIAILRSVPQKSDATNTLVAAESSLKTETRSHVSTVVAANSLNRSPQTLRKWACYQHGPIRPARVNGRLAWPMAEIRRVLEIEASFAPPAS